MNKRLIGELGLQSITGEFVEAEDRDIAKIDQDLNITLPADYKTFLKSFGPALFGEEVVFAPLKRLHGRLMERNLLICFMESPRIPALIYYK